MKSMLRSVRHGECEYIYLMFVCPGCIGVLGGSGLHMIPVNSSIKEPHWIWDGNLERPTLSPSLLTGKSTADVCHSFLRDGVFEFLNDCTHALAGQKVDMPDLPDWVTNKEDI